MPLKVTDYYIDSYTTQMREHVLNRLTETFGVDTSDEALRKAVAEHNEVCKIITKLLRCASSTTRSSRATSSTSSTS